MNVIPQAAEELGSSRW